MTENEHVSTHRFISEFGADRIASQDVDRVPTDDDIFFKADHVIETPDRVVYVSGTIGYPHDRVGIQFIYDIPANKIYSCNKYRFFGCEEEYALFEGSFEYVYDRLWQFVEDEVVEKKDETTYEETMAIASTRSALPYYRFPRTKDGVHIARIVHNIFKVYRDGSRTDKPMVVIPYAHYVYKQQSVVE